MSRFKDCGSDLYVVRHRETGRYRLTGNLCRDRWCPTCQAHARRRLVPPLREAITHAHADDPHSPPRMLLLTIRHTMSPLEPVIRRLKACWRALTQDPWWQEHQSGGVWALEVKRSDHGNGWHVHLHAIVMTPWLDQKELAKRWHAITTDSTVVDIRPIEALDPEQQYNKAVGYVAKYITKPARLEDVPTDDAAEIVEAAKHIRLWSTWGSLKAAKAALVEAEEDKYHAADWSPVAPLPILVGRALQGDSDAMQILVQLRLAGTTANARVRDPSEDRPDTS